MLIQMYTLILPHNMKLSATLKNNRGGSKVTADDTRILIDLKLGNKFIGTVGFYVVRDYPSGEELGYRVMWQHVGCENVELEEVLKGKTQTSKRDIDCHCGYPCVHGTDYCERHQIP